MSEHANRSPSGLFEELTGKVGAGYLSDLASPAFHPALIEVLKEIKPASYSLEEWKDLLSYVLRREVFVDSADDAKVKLIETLKEGLK